MAAASPGRLPAPTAQATTPDARINARLLAARQATDGDEGTCARRRQLEHQPKAGASRIGPSGSELRVEKVNGIDDAFAELIGQVVRVPYPKVRHSSSHTRKSNPSVLSDAWLPAKSALSHKSIYVE